MLREFTKIEMDNLIIEAINDFISENPVLPPTGVAKPQPQVQAPKSIEPSVVPAPKANKTMVNFDQDTKEPFSVTFSERGFSIGGTRLSFEVLEQALSKGYSITLNQGEGLELTPVRMQKIMKYKDIY